MVDQSQTPPETEKTAPSALAPLGHSIFRSVWLASMASNLGGLIQSVGASWMMTSISGEAHMVALVQASVSLPIMLLSLVAGAFADNFDRRSVMLGAQMFMFLISVTLTVCAWFDLLTPWLLLTFTFLIGCGMAFNGPAWQASVGEMVPRKDLPGAIALNSMGFNIARSLGPALGGAIVAALGAAAAFAINAVSYVGLIWVLRKWRPERPKNQLPSESLATAMISGIRYVALSPSICTILMRGALFGFSAVSTMALMPLIARDLIGGGAMTFGLLLGAFGVGAVAGALGISRLRALWGSEGMVRIAIVSFMLSSLIGGASESLALTITAMLCAGVGWVLALSTFNLTVQLSAPRWVVARALALYQMSTFGGMAIGSWVWGMVASGMGISAALYGTGIALIASMVLSFRYPLREMKDINLDPLQRWKEPEVTLPVEPRSGPIVISISYRIKESDVPALLNAMAERRRIRRRDGARDWALMRDLANPELWIERYRVETWLEYIRHNSRTTQDDAAVSDMIMSLHQGDEPPTVRRMIERQTIGLPEGRAPGARELAEPLTDPNRGF